MYAGKDLLNENINGWMERNGPEEDKEGILQMREWKLLETAMKK